MLRPSSPTAPHLQRPLEREYGNETRAQAAERGFRIVAGTGIARRWSWDGDTLPHYTLVVTEIHRSSGELCLTVGNARGMPPHPTLGPNGRRARDVHLSPAQATKVIPKPLRVPRRALPLGDAARAVRRRLLADTTFDRGRREYRRQSGRARRPRGVSKRHWATSATDFGRWKGCGAPETEPRRCAAVDRCSSGYGATASRLLIWSKMFSCPPGARTAKK
jgi:hypothetical protein